MAVSKKRKSSKKKLKVVSRRGAMPSKEFRDNMRDFVVQLEDTFYNYLFEVIDASKGPVEERYKKDIKLDDLDDLYAAKSINHYSNLITATIRKFADVLPTKAICLINGKYIPLIEVMGHNEFMRIIHRLVLSGEALLDDEFSGIARKYAKAIIEKDNIKGNSKKAHGLGSVLIDRYLLEIDARRALECGVSPVPALCSNTELMLKYFICPEEFSENPQMYALDNMASISESREYWNVTKEEVEKYESKELTSTDTHNYLHPEDAVETVDLEEEPEVDEVIDTRPRYSYIGDWKELSSLAEEQGFTKIRQKGDHGVFRHKRGLTVIIPQGRPIGRGLSYEIQKALFAEDKTGSAWYGVNFH